ncbi:MAG: hypothetical protein KGL02_13560, partial [Acidobacteriota bacterium]|nr:hypothetical protein [Acidobacteriota bacterium]
LEHFKFRPGFNQTPLGTVQSAVLKSFLPVLQQSDNLRNELDEALYIQAKRKYEVQEKRAIRQNRPGGHVAQLRGT